MPEKKKFQPVTSNGVFIAYRLLHKGGFVSFVPTEDSRKKVDAIVANITASYFGTAIYATPEEKAVAYLYFLIKGHPFVDGNKRTATLVFEVVCALNELEVDYGSDSLDEIAVYIEQTPSREHRQTITSLAEGLFS